MYTTLGMRARRVAGGFLIIIVRRDGTTVRRRPDYPEGRSGDGEYVVNARRRRRLSLLLRDGS